MTIVLRLCYGIHKSRSFVSSSNTIIDMYIATHCQSVHYTLIWHSKYQYIRKVTYLFSQNDFNLEHHDLHEKSGKLEPMNCRFNVVPNLFSHTIANVVPFLVYMYLIDILIWLVGFALKQFILDKFCTQLWITSISMLELSISVIRKQ